QQNLSASTHWAQNAITVAGLANGTYGSSPSTLYFNQGIRITNDNILYIADSSNNRIVLIGPDSTMAIDIIQNAPDSSPLFSYPSDIFVTEKYIYIADSFNYRVVRLFKNRTNPVTIAGINGALGTTPNTSVIGVCYSISVDSNENLYVSDFLNNRVVRYSSNSSSGMLGAIIAGDGIDGNGISQLNRPWGIFVNEAETLYVADYLNHRIQKWDKGASFGVTVAGTGVSDSSSTIISTSTITTTTTTITTTITDHTTSLEASSESSRTHSTTVAVSIAVLVVLC
ncbi:unnamed protein product, partial [Rotaria sordida]